MGKRKIQESEDSQSIPIILTETNLSISIENVENKAKKIRMGVEDNNPDLKDDVLKERIEHDHNYTCDIPYFKYVGKSNSSEDLVKNKCDEYKKNLISKVSIVNYDKFSSKDDLVPEEDLMCKEVMESEESMEKRLMNVDDSADQQANEADGPVTENEVLSSFRKLDETSIHTLSFKDASKLLNALDNDIEQLMKEDGDYLDEEEDFVDDEYELFPVDIKREGIEEEFDFEKILSNPDEYIDINSFDNELKTVPVSPSKIENIKVKSEPFQTE